MVFGTVHLDQVKGLEPDMLEEYMAKFKAFKPENLGIELMLPEIP